MDALLKEHNSWHEYDPVSTKERTVKTFAIDDEESGRLSFSIQQLMPPSLRHIAPKISWHHIGIGLDQILISLSLASHQQTLLYRGVCLEIIQGGDLPAGEHRESHRRTSDATTHQQNPPAVVTVGGAPEPPAPRQHHCLASFLSSPLLSSAASSPLLSSAPPPLLALLTCYACWPSHLSSMQINKKKFKPSILDNLHREATSTIEKLRLVLEDKRCSHWSPLDLMNQATHPHRP
jgi:hypothetical protein